MFDRKKEFVCLCPDCDKLATRVLTYFVDEPTFASLSPKQDVFCDEHAEDQTLNLQKPGFFTTTEADGTETICTVNALTNYPI
jgi:hypothetical protein